MKIKHMKKRISYFKALRGLSKNDIKKYMRICPDILIHVICEACFNLCHHCDLQDEDICREREPCNNSNVPYVRRSIRNRPRSRILYNNFM